MSNAKLVETQVLLKDGRKGVPKHTDCGLYMRSKANMQFYLVRHWHSADYYPSEDISKHYKGFPIISEEYNYTGKR